MNDDALREWDEDSTTLARTRVERKACQCMHADEWTCLQYPDPEGIICLCLCHTHA